MPNDSFLATCPFYVKTVGTKFFCEAHYNDPDIENALVRQDFESAKALREFALERCCTDGFYRCRIAAVNFAMISQREYQHKIAEAYLGKKHVNKKPTRSEFFGNAADEYILREPDVRKNLSKRGV